MRNFDVLSAAFLVFCSSFAIADEALDLSTPEAAIRSHMTAFANRNTEAVAETSSFPIVQLVLEGQPTIYASRDDLDDESNRPGEAALVSAEEIDRKGDMVLFKVRMLLSGPEGSAEADAWWTVKQTDGEWRVSSRQWLGFVPKG